MASRKDVAREAGVSAASVSYYINNNGYVSAEARKRIQEAIEKLNYSPNQIARSLKIKDSKQFVFLCNEIRNPFYAQLVYRATNADYEKGYFILFSNVIDDDEYLKRICSYQISGLFASNNKIKKENLEAIVKQGIPAVVLRDVAWSDLDQRIMQIKIDYSNIFHEIAVHLEKGGYRNVHYISGAKSGKPDEVDEKTRNYRNAVGRERSGDITYNITDTKEAFQFVADTYSKEDCPDAFVCSNDAVAIGVVKGVTQLGLRIPEDVGVVGFDNTFQSRFCVPGLTSAEISAEKIGDIAISMLIEKSKGQKVEDYQIVPKLIIRESSSRNDL